MRLRFACLACLLVSLAASAGGAPIGSEQVTVTATPWPPRSDDAASKEEPTRFRTRWSVSLSASGEVSTLQPTQDLVPAVREPLEREIRRWRFQAGTVDGRPAPTDTFLTVDISLTPAGEDKLELRIDDARTGGKLDNVKTVPRYPSEAIRHRHQGMVVLKVAYDANGRIIDIAPLEGARAVAPMLVTAAQAAVKHWTFTPEKVDGHAIAGNALVPVCFELSESLHPPESACEWTPPGSKRSATDGEAIALQPAARLQTEIAGRAL